MTISHHNDDVNEIKKKNFKKINDIIKIFIKTFYYEFIYLLLQHDKLFKLNFINTLLINKTIEKSIKHMHVNKSKHHLKMNIKAMKDKI